MPKIRKELIKSSLTDLRDVSKVTEHIRSWFQEIDITSTSSSLDYKRITEDIQQKDTAGEQYITVLEILHDKIYYFLSAILNFIELIPLTSTNNISNSSLLNTSMTLGTIITTIWNKLQDVRQNISQVAIRNIKKIGNICSSDRASQTDICGLQQCANCNVAQRTIKQYINIVHMLFKYAHDSKISQTQQEQLEPEELLNSTDWVIMQRCTSAIENDLNFFVCDIRKYREEHEACDAINASKIEIMHSQISELEEQITKYKLRVDHLIKDKATLELELYRNKAKVDFEALERKKIEEENASLQNRCIENTKLIKTIISLEEELERNIAKCNIVFKRFQETELHTEVLISHNANFEQMTNKHIEELKTRHSECEKVIAKLETYTDDKDKELDGLKIELEVIKNRLKKADNANGEYITRIQELEDNIKENERKFIILLYNPDFFGEMTAKRVECEPMRDMENQVEANEIRIQMLAKHNDHLRTILIKMKARSTANANK